MKFHSWCVGTVLLGSLIGSTGLHAQTTLASPTTLGAPITPVTTEPAIENPDPLATDPKNSNSPAQHTGFVEFLSNRLAPYEPMYFVIGTEAPNAKFQLSLRYQLFNDDGPAVQSFQPLKGLNFAYSQTSFWDTSAESAPFEDNSYRPEFLLHYDDLIDPAKLKGLQHIGLQAGLQHESNGQDGDSSRSLNYVYIRPMLTFGDRDNGGFFVTIAPRVHAYIAGEEDNEDMDEYRGYGDLRLIVGQGGGLQAAFIGRMGSDWDKGSIQMDLTFPMRALLAGNIDLYFNLQVFNGFGEGLLEYDESDTMVRAGISLVR